VSFSAFPLSQFSLSQVSETFPLELRRNTYIFFISPQYEISAKFRLSEDNSFVLFGKCYRKATPEENKMKNGNQQQKRTSRNNYNTTVTSNKYKLLPN
jgi:hypothetical protein